jgi:hypothetical protein
MIRMDLLEFCTGEVHAALKKGWLHRAHHQQAELQSKQPPPMRLPPLPPKGDSR